MKKISLVSVLLAMLVTLHAQNESKLVIEASSNQTNDQPLVKFLSSSGENLMWINSDSYSNVFVGNSAGYSNMSYSGGLGNTFVGYAAARQSKTGGSNTAIGSGALYNNISGHSNTVGGFNALSQNSSGSNNTAIGNFALAGTVSSEFNTALGYNAGKTHNNGWNNVFLGANTDVNAGGLYNVVAIGQQTIVTASNTVRLGNEYTGSIGGWQNWSNVSDGRYKKNVKNNVLGLSFILRLQPVTYNLDVIGLSKALREDREWDEQMKAALSEKEDLVQTGFIAQDVEIAALDAGYDFSGVDAPKNESDFYGLRYAEFVVPLVKAVQELYVEVEFWKSETDQLLAKVKDLTSDIEARESKMNNQGEEMDLLKDRLEKLEALFQVNEKLYTLQR